MLVALRERIGDLETALAGQPLGVGIAKKRVRAPRFQRAK
jgi:hypothetical protein